MDTRIYRVVALQHDAVVPSAAGPTIAHNPAALIDTTCILRFPELYIMNMLISTCADDLSEYMSDEGNVSLVGPVTCLHESTLLSPLLQHMKCSDLDLRIRWGKAQDDFLRRTLRLRKALVRFIVVVFFLIRRARCPNLCHAVGVGFIASAHSLSLQ